jgi:hypothetical protein
LKRNELRPQAANGNNSGDCAVKRPMAKTTTSKRQMLDGSTRVHFDAET